MSNEELESVGDFEHFGGFDEEFAHPDINYCSFKVGSIKLTMPIESVREIIDLSEPVRLPGSPPHVRGLVHLRGNVIPVIDMAEIYGAPYDQEAEKKLIIIAIHEESLALISDGMPDLIEREEGTMINLHEFFKQYKVHR
jgi:purine-binding chemotaxis protein CheW